MKAIRRQVLFIFIITNIITMSNAQTSTGEKNIVLVHGAFADGSGGEVVCADLSDEKAAFMNTSQAPVAVKCFITPLSKAGWESKPSYGIVATEDKSINPDIERNGYKRAGAKVTELKGSHVIFMSKPKEVAEVIEAAAKAAH
jgi:hypothetical protein